MKMRNEQLQIKMKDMSTKDDCHRISSEDIPRFVFVPIDGRPKTLSITSSNRSQEKQKSSQRSLKRWDSSGMEDSSEETQEERVRKQQTQRQPPLKPRRSDHNLEDLIDQNTPEYIGENEKPTHANAIFGQSNDEKLKYIIRPKDLRLVMMDMLGPKKSLAAANDCLK